MRLAIPLTDDQSFISHITRARAVYRSVWRCKPPGVLKCCRYWDYTFCVSRFPIGPRDKIGESGTAIVAPGERRVLHAANRANARSAPASELQGKVFGFLPRGGEADGRGFAFDAGCIVQGVGQVAYGFYKYEAVQA